MKREKFPIRCKTKFHSWRKKYGMTIPYCAILFDVTEKSIRNWDKKDAPSWVFRMIHLFDRDLGGLHPDWKGITIKPNGKMYLGKRIGPSGASVGFSARHIKEYPNAINRLHMLENDIELVAREIVHRVERHQIQQTNALEEALALIRSRRPELLS
jgi:hypothetical protein